MTKDEAFVLHLRSLVNDCVNNHVGTLRCRAEEIDLVEGELDLAEMKEYLRSEATLLLKKRKRIMEEIVEYLGGEERFTELLTEDFDSGYELSCYWCMMCELNDFDKLAHENDEVAANLMAGISILSDTQAFVTQMGLGVVDSLKLTDMLNHAKEHLVKSYYSLTKSDSHRQMIKSDSHRQMIKSDSQVMK